MTCADKANTFQHCIPRGYLKAWELSDFKQKGCIRVVEKKSLEEGTLIREGCKRKNEQGNCYIIPISNFPGEKGLFNIDEDPRVDLRWTGLETEYGKLMLKLDQENFEITQDIKQFLSKWIAVQTLRTLVQGNKLTKLLKKAGVKSLGDMDNLARSHRNFILEQLLGALDPGIHEYSDKPWVLMYSPEAHFITGDQILYDFPKIDSKIITLSPKYALCIRFMETNPHEFRNYIPILRIIATKSCVMKVNKLIKMQSEYWYIA